MSEVSAMATRGVKPKPHRPLGIFFLRLIFCAISFRRKKFANGGLPWFSAVWPAAQPAIIFASEKILCVRTNAVDGGGRSPSETPYPFALAIFVDSACAAGTHQPHKVAGERAIT